MRINGVPRSAPPWPQGWELQAPWHPAATSPNPGPRPPSVACGPVKTGPFWGEAGVWGVGGWGCQVLGPGLQSVPLSKKKGCLGGPSSGERGTGRGTGSGWPVASPLSGTSLSWEGQDRRPAAPRPVVSKQTQKRKENSTGAGLANTGREGGLQQAAKSGPQVASRGSLDTRPSASGTQVDSTGAMGWVSFILYKNKLT